MFGKTNPSKATQAKTPDTNQGTDRPSEAAPRDAAIQHSTVSVDTTVSGDIASKGDITIEGTVEGNIKCRCLTLSGAPVINGSAEAETVVVAGSFNGDIRAKKVVLAKNAKMRGDIFKETLEIHPGAEFEGKAAPFSDGKPAQSLSPQAPNPRNVQAKIEQEFSRTGT